MIDFEKQKENLAKLLEKKVIVRAGSKNDCALVDYLEEATSRRVSLDLECGDYVEIPLNRINSITEFEHTSRIKHYTEKHQNSAMDTWLEVLDFFVDLEQDVGKLVEIWFGNDFGIRGRLKGQTEKGVLISIDLDKELEIPFDRCIASYPVESSEVSK